MRCQPDSSPVFELEGESPCELATNVRALCQSSKEHRPQARPNPETNNPCRCSSVMFLLQVVCETCQGKTFSNWSAWSAGCKTTFIAQLPQRLVPGITLPQWSFRDPSHGVDLSFLKPHPHIPDRIPDDRGACPSHSRSHSIHTLPPTVPTIVQPLISSHAPLKHHSHSHSHSGFISPSSTSDHLLPPIPSSTDTLTDSSATPSSASVHSPTRSDSSSSTFSSRHSATDDKFPSPNPNPLWPASTGIIDVSPIPPATIKPSPVHNPPPASPDTSTPTHATRPQTANPVLPAFVTQHPATQRPPAAPSSSKNRDLIQNTDHAITNYPLPPTTQPRPSPQPTSSGGAANEGSGVSGGGAPSRGAGSLPPLPSVVSEDMPWPVNMPSSGTGPAPSSSAWWLSETMMPSSTSTSPWMSGDPIPSQTVGAPVPTDTAPLVTDPTNPTIPNSPNSPSPSNTPGTPGSRLNTNEPRWNVISPIIGILGVIVAAALFGIAALLWRERRRARAGAGTESSGARTWMRPRRWWPRWAHGQGLHMGTTLLPWGGAARYVRVDAPTGRSESQTPAMDSNASTPLAWGRRRAGSAGGGGAFGSLVLDIGPHMYQNVARNGSTGSLVDGGGGGSGSGSGRAPDSAGNGTMAGSEMLRSPSRISLPSDLYGPAGGEAYSPAVESSKNMFSMTGTTNSVAGSNAGHSAGHTASRASHVSHSPVTPASAISPATSNSNSHSHINASPTTPASAASTAASTRVHFGHGHGHGHGRAPLVALLRPGSSVISVGDPRDRIPGRGGRRGSVPPPPLGPRRPTLDRVVERER
ncbi:hypothetical protein HGRIS_012873 [Hohenbuehelia grisea]|uniref:Uncharacterized protein n=1 Tax=Hohenbuehelia grisea TaxID=104357 RepID=A0ABR3ITP2_9AGAR